MTFFQPLAFWSAVTIPLIILLYMLKKKTRPQTVSSIMLWQRLDRTSAPSLKINRLLRHLLLLLQILAACLLVLALAKPALPVVSGGAGSGSTIVIVDTSYSMLTVEDGESRFDLAINALQSMIGRKGSGEQIAIVSMAEQAQITSGLTADGSALLQAVENMNVTGGRANLQDALILAENLSHALEDASVVIISDGGSNESNIQIDMSLTFIPVGSEFVTNLLISDMIADGEGLYVTVHNNGTLPAGGTVQIKDSDGELIGQREVLLEPHQNAVLTWRQLADSPWYRGEIVAGDQLAWDDNFYAVSSGGENRRVLLVSEGNLFLERALMLQPGLAVTKARPSQFRPELSERYDYFVFDGYLPEDLPSAPLLVFDPPHPNPHFTTTIPFRPSRLQASAHPLTSYADFNEVTLSFAKAIGGGQPL